MPDLLFDRLGEYDQAVARDFSDVFTFVPEGEDPRQANTTEASNMQLLCGFYAMLFLPPCACELP